MTDKEITQRVRAWMVKEGLVGDDTPEDVVRRTLEARYPEETVSGEIEMRRGDVVTHRLVLDLPPDFAAAWAEAEAAEQHPQHP